MYNANARNLTVPCVLNFQLFAFGLNRSAIMIPKNTAAPMPAAAAVKPPVNAPRTPTSETAFSTPLASVLPKPVSGTVAPAHAHLTSGE